MTEKKSGNDDEYNVYNTYTGVGYRGETPWHADRGLLRGRRGPSESGGNGGGEGEGGGAHGQGLAGRTGFGKEEQSKKLLAQRDGGGGPGPSPRLTSHDKPMAVGLLTG